MFCLEKVEIYLLNVIQEQRNDFKQSYEGHEAGLKDLELIYYTFDQLTHNIHSLLKS